MSEKEEQKKEREIRISKDSDEIPVEDIRDILQVVNKEVPGLIKGLFSALYDAETAEQYAKGIATIYKTLNEQGLPPELVHTLVMKYSDSINILGSAMKGISFKGKKDDEDED
ncbi:MAG: hypothetical protein FK734_17695 [Asgard group archaeon]|nr:hypothetical protein [Asgard group archaeon]